MGKIVIVDGNSLLYKAYADIPALLSTGKAEEEHLSTSAIYGFLKILTRVCGEENPSHVCVVLQTKVETYQHRICKDVMSEARRLPIDLKKQLIELKSILEKKDIHVCDVDTSQAGAFIVSMCDKYTDMEKTVLTADRDLAGNLNHIADVMLLETKNQSTHLIRMTMTDNHADIVTGQETEKAFVDLSAEESEQLGTLSLEQLAYRTDDIQSEAEDNAQPFSMAYEIEEIMQETEAAALFALWANPEQDRRIVAFRFFDMEEEDSDLHASASGQMFLTLGNQKQSVFAMAVSPQGENKVYWLSTENGLSREFLTASLATLALKGAGIYAGFDIKEDYPAWTEQCRAQLTLQDTRRFFDTQIAAYLINPLKNDYKIDDIASEYLHTTVQKWSDLFGKADPSTAYAEQKKAFLNWKCQEAWIIQNATGQLDRKLQKMEMQKLFTDIEMPLTYVLFDMEQEGVLVKPEALKQYGESLLGRIGELEQIIYQGAGETFNINSPKQLGEILFGKLQLPGGKKTKSGYSTAADVLEKLSEEYPIVNDILEYRQLTKLKSTYADGLAVFIDKNNRIHTSYNQTITATGRLSSTEPNLQNIPMRMELGRMIRKIFVPKEGFIFMDADYSQIELRILAHMSEDEKLIEAYRSAKDIHRITASQVFHTPFDEVTDVQRRNAKAVNFGIVYGISSFGLSQGLSISRSEAAEYIERYFETYPGVKTFLDKLVSEAKVTGYSKSIFGRKRPIPELASSNYMQRQFGERVAMNAPIQGTAADIMKIAMVKVWEGIQAAGLKSRMILQVHDEVVIETAEDEVEQVRAILTESMESAAHLSVALDIDLHTGKDWYDAK